MNVIERIEAGEIRVGIGFMYNDKEYPGFEKDLQMRKDTKAELLRLAKLGAAMQWISVNDELPELKKPLQEAVYVLTYSTDCPHMPPMVSKFDYDVNEGTEVFYFADDDETMNHYVSHWMELPAGPGAESEAET